MNVEFSFFDVEGWGLLFQDFDKLVPKFIEFIVNDPRHRELDVIEIHLQEIHVLSANENEFLIIEAFEINLCMHE